MTHVAGAQRDDRIVTPVTPPPGWAGPAVSLSVGARDRAIALVVDLRFTIARLRLQLRDVELERVPH